jgi:hypothetical protein
MLLSEQRSVQLDQPTTILRVVAGDLSKGLVCTRREAAIKPPVDLVHIRCTANRHTSFEDGPQKQGAASEITRARRAHHK